jgi:6-aminohexanoate-oligomer exohydrolase
MILERLTGRSYVEHLSDFWQRLRPEGMVTVSTDNISTPYGLAGLSCTARDWARWGEMVRNMGHIDGQLVFPGVSALIEEIRQDSGHRTETTLTSAPPHTGYRNQFWTSVAEPGAEPLFFAAGGYFQNCLIDLRRRNVVVWMGSFWNRDAVKIAQGHTCAHCEVGFWSFVTEVLPKLVS